MNEKSFKIWRLLLLIFFIFFFTHFLKDITQDVLRIASPLDFFGDVKEDLSGFSESFVFIFHLIGILSLIGEIFLIITIPIVLKRKAFSRLEGVIISVIFFILLFFAVATTLDPRYNLF